MRERLSPEGRQQSASGSDLFDHCTEAESPVRRIKGLAVQEVALELARAELGARSKRLQFHVPCCPQQRTHHARRVTRMPGGVDHGGPVDIGLQALTLIAP